MAKPRISRVLDTLEVLGEIPKKAVGEVAKTLNPLEMANGQTAPQTHESGAEHDKQKKSDHTPLKVEKVKGQHELTELTGNSTTEDQKKLADLRSRLFHRVKGDEQRVIAQEARQVQEKKEVELTEEQRRQEEIKRRLAARQSDAPQGKVRRGGLFAAKKRKTNAVEENFVEMRGSGKH